MKLQPRPASSAVEAITTLNFSLQLSLQFLFHHILNYLYSSQLFTSTSLKKMQSYSRIGTAVQMNITQRNVCHSQVSACSKLIIMMVSPFLDAYHFRMANGSDLVCSTIYVVSVISNSTKLDLKMLPSTCLKSQCLSLLQLIKSLHICFCL